MTTLSKRVTDRIASSRTAEDAATRFAAAAAEGCAAACAPALEAEDSCPDVGLLFHLAARLLAEHRRRLHAADLALVEARQERAARRQRQDATAATVRAELMVLRRRLTTFFGAAEAARILGLSGATPREATALAAAARTVGERLAEPKPCPPAVIDGVIVDLAALAAPLVPAAGALDAAIADLVDHECHQRDALATQRRELVTFDRIYGTVARFLEATLELAHCDDLARGVRPGVGRRGRPPAVAVSASSSKPDTFAERLRAPIQKARELLTRRFLIWRKSDTSQATPGDATQKSKMSAASGQRSSRKRPRAKGEPFSPRKSLVRRRAA